MGSFGIVEPQSPGERAEDAGGDTGGDAAFELRVVLDAHPGEGGDLAAAQPGTRRWPLSGSPACAG